MKKKIARIKVRPGCEVDYLDKLSPDERAWLEAFERSEAAKFYDDDLIQPSEEDKKKIRNKVYRTRRDAPIHNNIDFYVEAEELGEASFEDALISKIDRQKEKALRKKKEGK